MQSTTRRRFLSTGLAATVTAAAGCLGAFGTTSDGQRALHLDLVHLDGPLRDRHVVDLAETRPEWDEEAFDATLDGSRYTTQYRKPFLSAPGDPKYAERDGTYYQLGSVIVDEVAVTRPVLRLRETDPETDQSSAGGVATEALPAGDRRAVEIAHLAARARGNAGGAPWGLVQRGGYVYRREAAIESSRLLADDGPEHVSYRETRYSVDIAREEFHEPVYRATVEPVATSPEQMEAVLRATFVGARIDRDALSTEARTVLREAQGDGYGETHPYSSGYREVLTKLHERAYLDGDIENDALDRGSRSNTVRYDGAYFDYRLRFRSGAP